MFLVRRRIGLTTAFLALGLAASCSSGATSKSGSAASTSGLSTGLGPAPYYHVAVTSCSPKPHTDTTIDVSGTITTNAAPVDYLIEVALYEGPAKMGEATVIANVLGPKKLTRPLTMKTRASWTAAGDISGGTSGIVTCKLLTTGNQLTPLRVSGQGAVSGDGD